MEKETIDKFIKWIYRILPIYEEAQRKSDFSNYQQTLDYDLSQMLGYKGNAVMEKVCECLELLKTVSEYDHKNVKKTVFFCCDRLESLKG